MKKKMPMQLTPNQAYPLSNAPFLLIQSDVSLEKCIPLGTPSLSAEKPTRLAGLLLVFHGRLRENLAQGTHR